MVLRVKRIAGTLVPVLASMLMPKKKNGRQIIVCFHISPKSCHN